MNRTPVAPRPITPWEAAYLRFETPDQEVRKFLRRFQRLRADEWPRDALILDLFCGRGSGEKALRLRGFHRIIGVDLSEQLLRTRDAGPDSLAADCRFMPVRAASADIAIVQGGLHHLPQLPDDLAITLDEVQRVLKPGGLFVAVEPWRTPFLTFAHFVSEIPMVRRLSNRLDAFATMTEHEIRTYAARLTSAPVILAELEKRFAARYLQIRWGKIFYIGVRGGTA